MPPGKVVIIGSGTVATAAARVLMGLDARITVMSADLPRLAHLQESFGGRLGTRLSTPQSVAEELQAPTSPFQRAHPGAPRPMSSRARWCAPMGPGAVLVDASIDQGGASETSHVTTHSDPTYVEEGVVQLRGQHARRGPAYEHPGTYNATLPYVEALASRGVAGALAARIQGSRIHLAPMTASSSAVPSRRSSAFPPVPTPSSSVMAHPAQARVRSSPC